MLGQRHEPTNQTNNGNFTDSKLRLLNSLDKTNKNTIDELTLKSPYNSKSPQPKENSNSESIMHVKNNSHNSHNSHNSNLIAANKNIIKPTPKNLSINSKSISATKNTINAKNTINTSNNPNLTESNFNKKAKVDIATTNNLQNLLMNSTIKVKEVKNKNTIVNNKSNFGTIKSNPITGRLEIKK